jgi:hypothetical protein
VTIFRATRPVSPDATEKLAIIAAWMRHTGNWYRLHTGKTLAEALHILETDQVLFPY